jgi:hypothetical protein
MDERLWVKSLIFLFFLALIRVHVQGQATSSQGPRWLKFSKFSGFLTLQFQTTDEKNTSEGEIQYETDRRFLEGGFQLSTIGSIYHPNLLTFNIDANITGNRTKNTLISDASVHNSINNTYNIRLQFLKKKKINLEVFALSQYTTAERRFRGRFFSRHNRIGITVNSSTKILPFTLSIYNNHNTIDALTYSERDEKSKNIDFRATFFSSGKTRSFLTFKNKNYSESVYDVNYDSLEVLLDFRHNYGAGSLNNVSSIMSFNKMKGNYNFELLRLILNSQYFFKKHLDLRGVYTLTRDKAFQLAVTRHDLKTTLTHRLFESLTSSLLVGGRIEDSTVQRRDILLGGVTFNYRKKIPSGHIALYFSQQFENSENKSGGDLQHETETFSFSFSDTIILIRPGVDIDTIEITSPDFSHIYVPDVDYQINVINNVVHITRLPGGDIPMEGTVAVHYAFLAYPDYTLKSSFQQINASLAFLRYFELFYRRTLNDHNVSSEYVTPLFDSYNRQIAGAKFRTRFLTTEYSFEDYDATLSKYTANHIRASAAVTLFKRLQLGGSASMSHLKYKTGILYNKFKTYSGNINFNPSPRFNARAVYRKISYETSEYFRDRESILFKVRWEFRKMILEAFYEHVFDGYQQDERLHDFFSLSVKRRFGK